MPKVTILPSQAWRRAKRAFSTRRVRWEDAVGLADPMSPVVSGDLVLARVETLGSHKRLQLECGRPSQLYPGDLIVAACADRYAPDQFEGVAELGRRGADLLAGGGIIGRMRHRNARISAPTRVVPLGLMTDAGGEVINIARYGLARRERPRGLPAVAVVGASMNAGKTTAAASLVHGLSRGGHAVAAIKATGTGACGDFTSYVDAGAQFVADFTDAGMASTYRLALPRIEAGLDSLLCHAAEAGADIAIVELADGLLQRETAALLRAAHVRDAFATFVFAAPDAMAAAGGCAMLRALGIEPAVLTGTLSLSPLGAAEAEAATRLPVTGREALADPAFAGELFARAVSAATGPRQGALSAGGGLAA